MKKNFPWLRIVLLIVWLIVLATAIVWFLHTGKSFHELFTYFRELILAAGHKAIIVFILLAWVRGFLFIPSWIFLTIAGLTFGLWYGAIIMYIADLGSALLEFSFIRYVARDFLGVHKRPILAKYNRYLQKQGIATVIFLRLIPIFHFDVLNFAFGISAVSWRDYLLGTMVAIIPGIIAYVLLGAGLENLSYGLIGLTLIVLLAIVGWFYSKKVH